MPKAIFGPPGWATNGWSYSFDSPVQVHATHDYAEVLPLLSALEAKAKAGYWIVMLLGYEAAPAFDPAFITHKPNELPLLWAAIFNAPSAAKVSRPEQPYELTQWQPGISREEYGTAVTEIRELIARGDTYQVNYTFPLTASFIGDSLAWYSDLCKAQGADYSVYLDLGRHQILSLSPELFFDRIGDRVTTRPMKGTIRRGRWQEEDQGLAAKLSTSPKDRAENVMIVDLLRNDLGRVSVPGSVEVSNLFAIERYETLWQMTSTVSSELRPKTSLTELLEAVFPCGSITGAPKIRTMEIIKELEPFARGVYTGAIGLLKPGGDCVFNVAIRTLVLDSASDQVTYGVGGGITFDSTAEREYEECLLKSSFLGRRIPQFQLLESMLLADGEIFLLERHLARLRSSSEFFGFTLNVKAVNERLRELVTSHETGDWKLRLLSSKNGSLVCEVLPLDELNLPLRVSLAAKPIASTDPFLFHKTTNRTVYEDALRVLENSDDAILWNERGEVTESTFANVAVLIEGEWFTPPRESGLLAGTFREELLAQGKLHERVVRISELESAEQICLINSVRKWIPTTFGSRENKLPGR